MAPAARDLSLTLDPTTSQAAPESPATFAAHIYSNQDDVYTLTVTPPSGWQAGIDPTGQVTVVPAPGAPSGDHAVQVTAQSVNSVHPLFTTAIHTVTIAPYHSMQLAVAPDPLTTVPMGAPIPNTQSPISTINNGQAQVPGAAHGEILMRS